MLFKQVRSTALRSAQDDKGVVGMTWGLLIFFRCEFDGYGIDTVPRILWRMVLTQKDVSKMPVAFCADDLGSDAVCIELLFDGVFYLVVKAWPAAA